MTFSDANPVQFWLIDCDTYNEEERFGLYQRCFCAPWECDDEIKTQFQDIAGQNFSLLIYDGEDSLLDNIPFEETSEGVYFNSFIPSDNTPGICDKNIRLEVRQESGMQAITLPALSTWLTHTDANVAWTLGAAPTVNLPGTGLFTPAISELLYVDYSFVDGLAYTITINYTRVVNSGTSNPRSSTLVIMDSSYNVLFTEAGTSDVGSGSNSTTISFTATALSSKIGFKFTSGLDCDITVNSTSGTKQVGTPQVIAKSDCLSIKETQEGTLLISYSNARNYAGLINNNGSPDLTFFLRIAAVFNEERFPEEEEPLQLSNNRIISLNSQVKAQKLLETDQMPFYMHRKMKLVLKHQFLTIEDKDYVQEEPYEQVENSNKRWPMRRYTCWLTEKEYVIRNIL